MAQRRTKSVAGKVSVILTKNNVAVTGLADTDVACFYRKPGQTTLSSKSLAGNWTESGQGEYLIDFSAAELDTLSPPEMVVTVTGASIDQAWTSVEIVDATVATTAKTPDTCLISANLNGPDGKPLQNAVLNASLLAGPTVQFGYGISDEPLSELSDANGVVTIELVRLAVYEIIIPRIGYRRTLTVPNQTSASLFELA